MITLTDCARWSGYVKNESGLNVTMKIKTLRLVGIRAFEDTGTISMSSTCNVFVGENNAGKSTLLKGLLAYQGFPFSEEDVRPNVTQSYHAITIAGTYTTPRIGHLSTVTDADRIIFRTLRGAQPDTNNLNPLQISNDLWLPNVRPNHYIVPFLARRKAQAFNQNVATQSQNAVEGTFSNLYSRIDLLATAGHPRHLEFQHAVRDIVGVPITTRAALNGKEAGFYFDQENFVSLERMGDGVSEMVALIVELCLEKDKIFVLEEPETNLHPRGLRALLSMVRSSMEYNQFVIATHSNIVIRDLAFDERTKVFRVARTGPAATDPSVVAEIAHDPISHAELLSELGYEFADMGLHEGWLFLEESSAERVIRDILIPIFLPQLDGRIRTFAAGGTGNLEPSLADFQRLTTYLHLQPIYKGKLWIRADGDPSGKEVISKIRDKFDYLSEDECSYFKEENFEKYYPAHFKAEVDEVLAIAEKQARRSAKTALLLKVLNWTDDNATEARVNWQKSAAEVLSFLKLISETLNARQQVRAGE